MTSPTLRVLSLGAGVQSSTLYLMAVRGEFGDERPAVAIFADTQAEPRAVYDWLNKLEQIGGDTIPITRVTEGSLTQIIGRARPTGQWHHLPIPAYIDMGDGKSALANRSCTRDYKIRPIRREVRRLLGIAGKKSPTEPVAEQWIGISLDEVQRMKDSPEPWIEHRWPLIERRMTRADCLRWLKQNGYGEAPKSSCTFCPYHDATAWRQIKNDPSALAEAIEVDQRIRDMWKGSVPGSMYLHRSLKPLTEALDDSDVDDGQMDLLDMFTNECEGMCGV